MSSKEIHEKLQYVTLLEIQNFYKNEYQYAALIKQISGNYFQIQYSAQLV